MANITSATSGNSNVGATWTGGSVPTSADNAIIQDTHTVTQNAAHTFKSLRVETGGTWTADGSNHLTLSGENDSDFALQIVDGTYNHANGTVVINNGGGGIAHAAIQAGVGNSTTGLYDLTISGGGTICEIYGDTTIHRNMEAGGSETVLRGSLTVTGNLTINATLNTRFSSTDKNLTVAGTTQVTGTLTCNSSAISLGTGLTSGWGLDIQSGGTFNGGSATHTIGSIFAAGGGTRTITLSSGATTIDSKNTGNGYSINLASGATFNHGSGTVTMTYAGNTLIQLSGGTLAFNTFTYNASGRTLELRSPMSCAGNLTLTAGTLDTKSGTNHALTVTGTTTIGPASGAADQATLTCNASTVSLGTTRQQGDYALNIEQGGTFVGGTGTHTVGSLYMAQSANAKATMTTAVMTINGYNNSANKAWRVEYGGDTFDNANGTVRFNFNGFDTRMSMRSESHANNAFHNLIIQMNGDTRTLSIDNGTDVKVDNDLTVSRGVLNAGSNHNLEVVGHVDVGTDSEVSNLKFTSTSTKTATFKSILIGANGTYEATSGTTTLKGEHTNGFAWYNNGTFTDNDGTVTIGDGSTSIGTTHIQENRFHHLTINRDAENVNTVWRDVSGNTLTIDGNLTMTKGFFYRNTVTDTLTVTGDVDIAANGRLGLTADTGANNFGSLTIASGGAYYATSGTTTITDQTGGGYGWNNAGTFTHNNGKVTFTDNLNPYIIESTFYDMEINLAQNTSELRSDDIGGAGFTILNDLTITRGRFKFNTAGDSMTVHGLTKLETNGQFGLNSPSGTHTFNGLVTVNGGTWFLSSGTNNMAGIRNVGGTIS
jgi:hypothetical protein